MLKRMSDEEMRLNGRHQTHEVPAIPAWSSPVRQLIFEAEKKGSRVTGLTGERHGAGVSTLARELAIAYGSLGKRAVVVDMSGADVGLTAYESPGTEQIELARQHAALQDAHSAILLSDVPTELVRRRAKLRAILDGIGDLTDAVIVDLPPVGVSSAEAPSVFLAAAPACQQVYLVCLTGNAPAAGLRDCLEICKIGDVPLGGIILNDFNLTSTNLTGLKLST